mgnify:CR=1 FL=1
MQPTNRPPGSPAQVPLPMRKSSFKASSTPTGGHPTPAAAGGGGVCPSPIPQPLRTVRFVGTTSAAVTDAADPSFQPGHASGGVLLAASPHDALLVDSTSDALVQLMPLSPRVQPVVRPLAHVVPVPTTAVKPKIAAQLVSSAQPSSHAVSGAASRDPFGASINSQTPGTSIGVVASLSGGSAAVPARTLRLLAEEAATSSSAGAAPLVLTTFQMPQPPPSPTQNALSMHDSIMQRAPSLHNLQRSHGSSHFGGTSYHHPLGGSVRGGGGAIGAPGSPQGLPLTRKTSAAASAPWSLEFGSLDQVAAAAVGPSGGMGDSLHSLDESSTRLDSLDIVLGGGKVTGPLQGQWNAGDDEGSVGAARHRKDSVRSASDSEMIAILTSPGGVSLAAGAGAIPTPALATSVAGSTVPGRGSGPGVLDDLSAVTAATGIADLVTYGDPHGLFGPSLDAATVTEPTRRHDDDDFDPFFDGCPTKVDDTVDQPSVATPLLTRAMQWFQAYPSVRVSLSPSFLRHNMDALPGEMEGSHAWMLRFPEEDLESDFLVYLQQLSSDAAGGVVLGVWLIASAVITSINVYDTVRRVILTVLALLLGVGRLVVGVRASKQESRLKREAAAERKRVLGLAASNAASPSPRPSANPTAVASPRKGPISTAAMTTPGTISSETLLTSGSASDRQRNYQALLLAVSRRLQVKLHQAAIDGARWCEWFWALGAFGLMSLNIISIAGLPAYAVDASAEELAHSWLHCTRARPLHQPAAVVVVFIFFAKVRFHRAWIGYLLVAMAQLLALLIDVGMDGTPGCVITSVLETFKVLAILGILLGVMRHRERAVRHWFRDQATIERNIRINKSATLSVMQPLGGISHANMLPLAKYFFEQRDRIDLEVADWKLLHGAQPPVTPTYYHLFTAHALKQYAEEGCGTIVVAELAFRGLMRLPPEVPKANERSRSRASSCVDDEDEEEGEGGAAGGRPPPTAGGPATVASASMLSGESRQPGRSSPTAASVSGLSDDHRRITSAASGAFACLDDDNDDMGGAGSDFGGIGGAVDANMSFDESDQRPENAAAAAGLDALTEEEKAIVMMASPAGARGGGGAAAAGHPPPPSASSASSTTTSIGPPTNYGRSRSPLDSATTMAMPPMAAMSAGDVPASVMMVLSTKKETAGHGSELMTGGITGAMSDSFGCNSIDGPPTSVADLSVHKFDLTPEEQAELVAARESLRCVKHLVNEFDALLLRVGLLKICTVGDRYIAVAGWPQQRGGPVAGSSQASARIIPRREGGAALRGEDPTSCFTPLSRSGIGGPTPFLSRDMTSGNDSTRSNVQQAPSLWTGNDTMTSVQSAAALFAAPELHAEAAVMFGLGLAQLHKTFSPAAPASVLRVGVHTDTLTGGVQSPCQLLRVDVHGPAVAIAHSVCAKATVGTLFASQKTCDAMLDCIRVKRIRTSTAGATSGGSEASPPASSQRIPALVGAAGGTTTSASSHRAFMSLPPTSAASHTPMSVDAASSNSRPPTMMFGADGSLPPATNSVDSHRNSTDTTSDYVNMGKTSRPTDRRFELSAVCEVEAANVGGGRMLLSELKWSGTLGSFPKTAENLLIRAGELAGFCVAALEARRDFKAASQTEAASTDFASAGQLAAAAQSASQAAVVEAVERSGAVGRASISKGGEGALGQENVSTAVWEGRQADIKAALEMYSVSWPIPILGCLRFTRRGIEDAYRLWEQHDLLRARVMPVCYSMLALYAVLAVILLIASTDIRPAFYERGAAVPSSTTMGKSKVTTTSAPFSNATVTNATRLNATTPLSLFPPTETALPRMPTVFFLSVENHFVINTCLVGAALLALVFWAYSSSQDHVAFFHPRFLQWGSTIYLGMFFAVCVYAVFAMTPQYIAARPGTTASAMGIVHRAVVDTLRFVVMVVCCIAPERLATHVLLNAAIMILCIAIDVTFPWSAGGPYSPLRWVMTTVCAVTYRNVVVAANRRNFVMRHYAQERHRRVLAAYRQQMELFDFTFSPPIAAHHRLFGTGAGLLTDRCSHVGVVGIFHLPSSAVVVDPNESCFNALLAARMAIEHCVAARNEVTAAAAGSLTVRRLRGFDKRHFEKKPSSNPGGSASSHTGDSAPQSHQLVTSVGTDAGGTSIPPRTSTGMVRGLQQTLPAFDRDDVAVAAVPLTTFTTAANCDSQKNSSIGHINELPSFSGQPFGGDRSGTGGAAGEADDEEEDDMELLGMLATEQQQHPHQAVSQFDMMRHDEALLEDDVLGGAGGEDLNPSSAHSMTATQRLSRKERRASRREKHFIHARRRRHAKARELLAQYQETEELFRTHLDPTLSPNSLVDDWADFNMLTMPLSVILSKFHGDAALLTCGIEPHRGYATPVIHTAQCVALMLDVVQRSNDMIMKRSLHSQSPSMSSSMDPPLLSHGSQPNATPSSSIIAGGGAHPPPPPRSSSVFAVIACGTIACGLVGKTPASFDVSGPAVKTASALVNHMCRPGFVLLQDTAFDKLVTLFRPVHLHPTLKHLYRQWRQEANLAVPATEAPFSEGRDRVPTFDPPLVWTFLLPLRPINNVRATPS